MFPSFFRPSFIYYIFLHFLSSWEYSAVKLGTFFIIMIHSLRKNKHFTAFLCAAVLLISFCVFIMVWDHLGQVMSLHSPTILVEKMRPLESESNIPVSGRYRNFTNIINVFFLRLRRKNNITQKMRAQYNSTVGNCIFVVNR